MLEILYYRRTKAHTKPGTIVTIRDGGMPRGSAEQSEVYGLLRLDCERSALPKKLFIFNAGLSCLLIDESKMTAEERTLLLEDVLPISVERLQEIVTDNSEEWEEKRGPLGAMGI